MVDARQPRQAPLTVSSTVRRSPSSRANANAAPLERDDIAKLQLPPTTAIDLAVHGDVAVDDGLFNVATGVEEAGELEELAEADGVTADRDVVDWGWGGHAEMVAHAMRASDLDSAPRSGRAVCLLRGHRWRDSKLRPLFNIPVSATKSAESGAFGSHRMTEISPRSHSDVGKSWASQDPKSSRCNVKSRDTGNTTCLKTSVTVSAFGVGRWVLVGASTDAFGAERGPRISGQEHFCGVEDQQAIVLCGPIGDLPGEGGLAVTCKEQRRRQGT